jgi:ferredoxin
MRIVVDLNRCQSYGQCVFAAPAVFRFRGEESLEYDHTPGAESDREVRRAALACPVRAITIGEAADLVSRTTEVHQTSGKHQDTGQHQTAGQHHQTTGGRL